MKLIVLPGETRALDGFNRKLVLTYLDLLTWTSGVAQAVVPVNAFGVTTITNPATCVIGRVLMRVVTAFASSGGVITTLTFSLGDGGSATRFLNAVDLKTAAYTAGASQTNGIFLYTTADTVDAVATITGQTMASLNAGQIEIAFELLDPTGIWLVAQP